METPSRKKILFVITKSNWGGAQKYVYDLATHLPKDSYAVSVAFGQDGQMAEKLREAGVPTFSIQSLARDISPLRDLASVRELYHLFKREQPDVVHLNSSKAGGVGALAARLAGVPRIVFTAHGWPFQEKSRGLLWRAAAHLGSWETALFAHLVLVVSKNDLAIGQSLPFCAHKMRLIYNGIESDFASRLSSGEGIRNAFPLGVHITGTIGEINKNKNQISLIEQAKNNPDMYVAIVGDGEERMHLETKIKEYGLENRVKLFGFMTASEVMRGFDTFALPSLKEGLPYVLIEARAAGLPIVANRVGGVSEILDAPDLSEFSIDKMVEKTAALYR